MDAFAEAKDLEEYVVSIRRRMHEYPEIAGKAEKTIPLIVSELASMGITAEVVPQGGVIAVLEGNKGGKTLILRADFDALPMKESSDNLAGPKVCVSKDDGAAQMCGHDGHTAMLLGAAKILAAHRDLIEGRIVLAFEDGEESGYGILGMLNRLLEIGADGIWGIHLQAAITSGKISVSAGPRMAGAFVMNVKIIGKGGHGSRPDLSVNPLDCFVALYSALNTGRFTKLNPFYPVTMSIGTLHMGSARNIIPDELTFGGTYRFLDYERSGKVLVAEFERLVKDTYALHGCRCEFLTPLRAADTIVFNNKDCSDIAVRAVAEAVGSGAVFDSEPWMASESMSLYQKYFPGVFAFVGLNNPAKGIGAEHHNDRFDLDEDMLKLGVAATVQYAMDFLKSGTPIHFTPYSGTPIELLKLVGLA